MNKVTLSTVRGPIKGVLFKGLFSKKMKWAFVVGNNLLLMSVYTKFDISLDL